MPAPEPRSQNALAAGGDPFDIDEIRFSSDDADDDVQEERATGIERSAASLLAAFKSSRRAQHAPAPDAGAIVSGRERRDFDDDDSVVEFDRYGTGPIVAARSWNVPIEFRATPDDDSFEDDLGDVVASGHRHEPRAPESVPIPTPAVDGPARRPRSIFDTIAQLRSKSNSSSPTRRDDPATSSNVAESGAIDSTSASDSFGVTEPNVRIAANITNASSNEEECGTTSSDRRAAGALPDADRFPESVRPVPIPAPNPSAGMSTTTTSLLNVADTDAPAADDHDRADDVPVVKPASEPGASRDFVPHDHAGDGSYRSESVSPTHSAATIATVCDSNADLDRRPTEPAMKSDSEPATCPSPKRREPTKNALRNIKRKVDLGRRARRRDDDQPGPIEQEERLKELERDKFLLESQVTQLSVSVSGSFRERIAAGAPLPAVVTDSQLEDIKKEMQTMEKIIDALNDENAKLYASLRGEQITMKGTAQQMLTRNKTLHAELDLAKAEIEELRAAKLTTADEDAQEEVRRLKHAIVQQRNDLEAKLRTAQAQIDTYRRANDDLEYRLSTVHYEPVSPRRQRPATPIKSKSGADKHEKEIAELREKLQWYIENQKMIDDLQRTIDQKDESIRTLQHRVDLLYAETKSGKKKAASTVAAGADARRVRELENEIAQLKKQQPHKRAVSALVRAANRPDQRTVEQLQKAVEDLQQELAARDADYVARMRSLRQECDKMRVQYDERLAQLLADRREQARPHERIRELEEQIEEMRDTYRRKGHVVVKRCTTNSSAQTDGGDVRDRRDDDDDRRDSESRQLQQRIEVAEEQNRRDRDRIEELGAELARRSSRADPDLDAVVAALNDAHAAQIDALHGEIRHLTESLRNSPDAILDRNATAHLVASLQSQLDVAMREKTSLKESLIETQYELSRVRSMPTQVQISALEMKLNEIEGRHATREVDLRDALRHLQQQAESRSRQSTSQYQVTVPYWPVSRPFGLCPPAQAMVREKNAQIGEFKAELDVLLGELARLQPTWRSR